MYFQNCCTKFQLSASLRKLNPSKLFPKIVCLVAEDSVSGDRIRDLEYQLSSQQENFAARMRDMEAVIRRQEELLAHVKVNGEC